MGALDGRVAVITGGASGIGRATVLRFLREGAKVVIADYNAETGNEALGIAKERGHGPAVRFSRTDVANEENVEATLNGALDAFGRLDILFNNAGVPGAIGPLTETSVAAWDYTFEVVTRSVFLGTKHAARIMQQQGDGGSIINTSSIAALSGDCGPHAYSAAKAAVISLSKTASIELAPDLIRVNAICPGFINTPILDGGKPDKTAERFATTQPWPESGNADHIAGTALFLAGNDARFITGEVIVVDGGMTTAGPGVSRRFEDISGRGLGMTGISRGTTGVPFERQKAVGMLSS